MLSLSQNFGKIRIEYLTSRSLEHRGQDAFQNLLYSTVQHNNQSKPWKSIITHHTRALCRHLNNDKQLTLTSPKPDLTRDDTQLLRQKIKQISYTEWEKRGYSKGTLHYMKQNADSQESFSLNEHVKERVLNW